MGVNWYDATLLEGDLGLKLAVFVRRPRVLVVDEEHAVTHEHLVLDSHPRTDERVALDLAAGTDLDPPLDLDERPDPRLVADPAAVEVRERMDDDALAELDVDDDSIRRFVRRSVRHAGSSSRQPRPPR